MSLIFSFRFIVFMGHLEIVNYLRYSFENAPRGSGFDVSEYTRKRFSVPEAEPSPIGFAEVDLDAVHVLAAHTAIKDTIQFSIREVRRWLFPFALVSSRDRRGRSDTRRIRMECGEQFSKRFAVPGITSARERGDCGVALRQVEVSTDAATFFAAIKCSARAQFAMYLKPMGVRGVRLNFAASLSMSFVTENVFADIPRQVAGFLPGATGSAKIW